MALIARALQLIGAWAAKYLKVYRILLAKRAESLVFLGLTICVGALGLWAPPLIASVNAHDSTKEFVKALEVGAGYMFALSTVATAMTFFAKEYLADHHSDFKEIKTVGAVVAGVPNLGHDGAIGNPDYGRHPRLLKATDRGVARAAVSTHDCRIFGGVISILFGTN